MTDDPDVNKEQGVDKTKEDSPSPSLVFYRLKEQNDETCLGESGAGQSKDVGQVVYRSFCQAPCWTTASQRYESPIVVGLGTDGVSA